MFLSWEDAKKLYPNKWVVFKNPQFGDAFHMDFLGGEFFITAANQPEVFSIIPDDIGEYTVRHTREDEAVGVLTFGY